MRRETKGAWSRDRVVKRVRESVTPHNCFQDSCLRNISLSIQFPRKDPCLENPIDNLVLTLFLSYYQLLQGEECPFRHDKSAVVKKREMCKFYASNSCYLGNDCLYMHNILVNLSFLLSISQSVSQSVNQSTS